MPPPSDRKFNRLKANRTLDKDGLSRIGEELRNGDIYINKHVPDP